MRIRRGLRGAPWLLLGIVCWAVPVGAGPAGEMLSRLDGRWVGEGSVLGMESRATMNWSIVLGGRFARLEFENVMRPPEGEPREFTALGLYPLAGDAPAAGRWFDSRGYELPLAIECVGETLVVDWGSAETESGRTTYTLVSPDELEVVDEVRREGELQEFGRIRYRRAANP